MHLYVEIINSIYISKIFASRLKKVLLNLISSLQTGYVAQRCIYESGRLISDLLSVTQKMKVKGYLVTKLNQGTTEYNQLLFIFYGFKTKFI